MDSSRIRLLGPLWLFGFLPSLATAYFLGMPLDWFFSNSGYIIGGSIFVCAYLLSSWLLNPAIAVVESSCRLLRGLPPDHKDAEWLPKHFKKLREEIHETFRRQHQTQLAEETRSLSLLNHLEESERSAQQSLAALQQISSISEDAIAISQPSGHLIGANHAWQACIGAHPPMQDQPIVITEWLEEHLANTETLDHHLSKIANGDVNEVTLETHLTHHRSFGIQIFLRPLKDASGLPASILWLLRPIRLLHPAAPTAQFRNLSTAADRAAAVNHAPTPSRLVSPESIPFPNTPRILVVDDEAPLRSLAVNMLNQLGFSTLEAASGEAALDLLADHSESIAAVMLDIYMPSFSGRDTFIEMRRRGVETPVILCSGHAIDPDEFVLLSQYQTPPLTLIAKPYTLEILASAFQCLQPIQNPATSELVPA